MRVSNWFVVITAVFVTCLLTANIIAVKLVQMGGLAFPAGLVVFPLSYLFADVLTEVYGYRQMRRVIWLGFFCNLILVLAIYAGQTLPPAAFWDGQEAYETILGYTPRLLVASFAGYLVGSFANSYVLAKMKIATRGRWLWSRTIGSTIVGEGLDSIVFIAVAFGGGLPLLALLTIMVTQWALKVAYEVIATPFTYWMVSRLKSVEGLDTYDVTTKFNPVRFAD